MNGFRRVVVDNSEAKPRNNHGENTSNSVSGGERLSSGFFGDALGDAFFRAGLFFGFGSEVAGLADDPDAVELASPSR